MTFRHEGIQIDHCDMIVKRLQDCFSSDTGRESGHGGKMGFFRHDLNRKITASFGIAIYADAEF